MLITSTPASAATATVTNYSELVAAIAVGDEIEIEGNITLEDDITLNNYVKVSAASTIDLAGHTINMADEWYGILSYADLTITGDDEIDASAYCPIVAVDGNLTIENGTFVGSDDVYYMVSTQDESWDSVAPDGKANANVYINGGVFNVPYSVVNNFGPGEVIITAGEFNFTGDSWGDGCALLNGLNGTVEINGEGVAVNGLYEILGDDIIDEDEERGTVTCTKGMVYIIETDAIYVCGTDIMEEEDDEVTDGLTVNLINDTHITVPKGIKLTNKGKIYVDGTSSIKVCRDDYEGDEADIYGEGEIPFDCEEEPEILPAETPEQENPATVDGIFIAFGVLGASMLGLLAAIGVLSFIERRA